MDASEEKTCDSLFDLTKLKNGVKLGHFLATDPEILAKFMKHLSTKGGVRRDETSKNMIFLTAVSKDTKNPINLFMKGPPSVGKTYITIQTLKYFPKEDAWKLGGLSPKALIHGFGILVDEKDEEIDFREKPGKDTSEEEKRRWKERVERSRYIIDLQGKILVFLEAPHIETYNMLRPILSHDAWEISYRFTDKTKTGGLRTSHVVIRGWPACIFCTTEEKYVEDLATRGFSITPEMGPEKYQAGIEVIGERKAHPRKFHEDRDFTLLQGYFRWLKNQFSSLNVAIPSAEDLAKHYPHTYARSMRDYDHFSALLEISALVHYAQRPVEVVEREEPTIETRREDGKPEGKVVMRENTKHVEEHTVLATFKDLEYVLRLWQEAEETTVTGLPGHILSFYHAAVEPLAEQVALFDYEQLTQRYNEVSDAKKSSDTIRKWVDYLCDVGWLNKEPDPSDKRKVVIRVIKTAENSGYSRIRIFPASFTLENLRKWWDEEKKISENNLVVLKENLLGGEASLESLYETHFRSDIFLELSKAEEEPAKEKEGEISGFRESPIIQRLSDGELIILLKARFGQEPFLQSDLESAMMKHGPRSKEEAESLREHLLNEGSMFYTPEGWLQWV